MSKTCTLPVSCLLIICQLVHLYNIFLDSYLTRQELDIEFWTQRPTFLTVWCRPISEPFWASLSERNPSDQTLLFSLCGCERTLWYTKSTVTCYMKCQDHYHFWQWEQRNEAELAGGNGQRPGHCAVDGNGLWGDLKPRAYIKVKSFVSRSEWHPGVSHSLCTWSPGGNIRRSPNIFKISFVCLNWNKQIGLNLIEWV